MSKIYHEYTVVYCYGDSEEYEAIYITNSVESASDACFYEHSDEYADYAELRIIEGEAVEVEED